MKTLKTLMLLIITMCLVAPAYAGLTVDNKEWVSLGNKRMLIAQVDFDDSYAYGGEAFDYTAYGFNHVDSVKFTSNSGVVFEYDYTNKKIKAFVNAPPIVFEESVTVTSNVGTLKYPGAYIVYVSTGNATFRTIPGGLTPVASTVAISEPVWGTRSTLTFLAADSVTSCKVTYITQAWKEVFDNYVLASMTAGVRVSGHADLAFTAATPDTVDLGELAVAVQGVTWNDNGTYKACKALYVGEDPATTEVVVDFSNATSSELRCSFKEEDTVDASTDTVYFQYIRKPASGFLFDRFVEEDDLTPSTDVVTVSSGSVTGSNMLLYGSCGGFPGPTTKFSDLISSSESVGSTATLVTPTTVQNAANTFTLGSGHGDTDHLKLSYIVGNPFDIPGLVPLEANNGYNLSDITNIRVEIIGN